MTASIFGPNSGERLAQQVVADGGHVDGAGRLLAAGRAAAARCGWPGTSRRSDSWMPPAAWRQAPTSAGRQAMVRTDMPPPAHALDAVVDADRDRLAAPRGLAVVARQADHFIGADAAGLGGALRRPFGGARLQLFEAERVLRDVVVVEQVLADQHVHHAERQRGVGAGQQRDMLVAFLGRQRAVRIDRDQAWRRAAWLPARGSRNAGWRRSGCRPR